MYNKIKPVSLFFKSLVVWLLFQHIVFAQNKNEIKGQIKSKSIALEFATVTLAKASDSTKFVAFTTSDSLGKFTFKNLLNEEYTLKFNLVGYKPLSIKVKLSNVPLVVAITVAMEENVNLLQGIQVVAQKNLVEKTESGFVLNAAANITQIGGSAADLLKNIPTLLIDAEGGISLRGKSPMILINGRNSNLANPDLIAANAIDRIEIINNATAKYDANAESGIINIILKKNKYNGLNGAIALGGGMGANARYSGSGLINFKTNKINIGLGYDNRYSGRTRNITGGRRNFKLDQIHQLTQNRNDTRVEQNQNLKLTLDLVPNIKNTLALELLGNIEGQDNFETLFTQINTRSNAFVSKNRRYSNEIARSKVGEMALDYERNFTDKRQGFTANISTSKSYETENTDIDTKQIAENNTFMANVFLEKTHNYENAQISNAKADYRFAISDKTTLEAGYKGLFRTIRADYEAGEYLANTFIVNTGASNIFNFKENVHAAYVMYSSELGQAKVNNWSYTIGLRAENVANDGYTINRAISISNTYLKLFPNAALTYQKSETQSLKLSYGKRINRPKMGQLNPFTDITDALNPHSGNPNLKPEIIHAFELGSNTEWQNNTFSTNLFFRNARNTIRPFYKPLGNGVNLSLPLNIGSADTYGLENVLNLRPRKGYDINTSLTLYQQHLNGSNISGDLVQDAFAWNGKLMQNFLIRKKGKMQVVANYNSDILTPQGKRNKQYYVDLGFQQKLGKGNARLGLTMIDVFNTLKSGYSNTTADFSNYRISKADTRAVMLTFGYTFKSAFKEKLLDNQFSKEY